MCPGSGLRRQVSGRRRTTSQNKPSAVSYQPQIALRHSPFAVRSSPDAENKPEHSASSPAKSEWRRAKSAVFPRLCLQPSRAQDFADRSQNGTIVFKTLQAPPEGGARAIRCSLFARRQSPRLLRRKANGEWRKASKNRSLARRGGLVMTNIR